MSIADAAGAAEAVLEDVTVGWPLWRGQGTILTKFDQSEKTLAAAAAAIDIKRIAKERVLVLSRG